MAHASKAPASLRSIRAIFAWPTLASSSTDLIVAILDRTGKRMSMSHASIPLIKNTNVITCCLSCEVRQSMSLCATVSEHRILTVRHAVAVTVSTVRAKLKVCRSRSVHRGCRHRNLCSSRRARPRDSRMGPSNRILVHHGDIESQPLLDEESSRLVGEVIIRLNGPLVGRDFTLRPDTSSWCGFPGSLRNQRWVGAPTIAIRGHAARHSTY